MNANERAFPLSKDILDTINSVSWFLLDASWMLDVQQLSLFMILPTILSGVFLVYIEKRRSVTFINVAILNWICMNITWMFSELYEDSYLLTVSKVFLGVGVLCIGLSIYYSENINETFSHFRRFRVKRIKDRV